MNNLHIYKKSKECLNIWDPNQRTKERDPQQMGIMKNNNHLSVKIWDIN